MKQTARPSRGLLLCKSAPKNASIQKPRAASRRISKGEGGFTLVELLVVIVLTSIMLTLSMMAFRAYSKSSEHRGSTRETVAILRNARTMAVSEAVTTECQFYPGKLEIYRGTGAPGPARTLVRTYELPPRLQYLFSGSVNGQNWGFSHPGDPAGPHTRTNCFFYSRGTAAGGQVGIIRTDRPSQHSKVQIEALTGRVSYCADPTPAAPCTP